MRGRRPRIGSLLAMAACIALLPTSPSIAGGSSCFTAQPTIVGTPDDDYLIGTGERDVIVGLGGDDVLLGRGSRDLLCGGAGRDVLKGPPWR
jgi:RTX calcium-binding nonapeptide repeat (4 copies)